jgi:transcriptional regulator
MLCAFSLFSDEAAQRIFPNNLVLYEKYLPFDDYIRLHTVWDAVLYTEKSDSVMHQHILEASENMVRDLHNRAMTNLGERIIRVNRKLSELRGNPGNRSVEIAVLSKQFDTYKANVSIHPELDEVMNEIEKLYSELIFRKQYRPKEERKVTYTVKKGDYLIRIAESLYNDWRKWKLIYQANKSIMPKPENPDFILPGMRLKIPEAEL